jgi:GNAT superfamily N-acetyltransferase
VYALAHDVAIDPGNTAVFIVEKFLCLPRMGRAWLEDYPVRVYMRRSKRLVNGALLDFTDVAAIEVEEAYRGKGYFTELVETLLGLGHNVCVECVHNERLRHRLHITGWDTFLNDPLTFYKISK